MRAPKGPLDYLAGWGHYDLAVTEKWHVMEARRLGLTWEQIAQALGRSRQSVWERWHADDDEVDHESACSADNYGFAYIGVPVSYGIGYGGKEIDPAVKCRRYVVKRLRRLRLDALRRDEVVPRLVGRCRSEGATWSDIGQALGISRQAAWRKYNRVSA
jgi:hypothetical protein